MFSQYCWKRFRSLLLCYADWQVWQYFRGSVLFCNVGNCLPVNVV